MEKLKDDKKFFWKKINSLEEQVSFQNDFIKKSKKEIQTLNNKIAELQKPYKYLFKLGKIALYYRIEE